MFPIDHFRWNALSAIILDALGKKSEAAEHARAALNAAASKHSDLTRLPTLGVVGSNDGDLRRKIARIASA